MPLSQLLVLPLSQFERRAMQHGTAFHSVGYVVGPLWKGSLAPFPIPDCTSVAHFNSEIIFALLIFFQVSFSVFSCNRILALALELENGGRSELFLLSLSHSLTLTHSYLLLLTLTHSHSLSLSLSLTLTHSHSLSHLFFHFQALSTQLSLA